MKQLYLTLLIILLSLTSFSAISENSMQDTKKQRLILIKQHLNGKSTIVGLKIVPDFFEGSLENFCLDMANKISNQHSVVLFRPDVNGKTYAVVSLNSGFISIEPFSDNDGYTNVEAKQKFNKILNL